MKRPALAVSLLLMLLATPGATQTPARYEPYTTSAEAKSHFAAAMFDLRNAFAARAVVHFEKALAADPEFGVARIYWGGFKAGLSAAQRQEEYAKGFASLTKAPAADLMVGVALREQLAGRTANARIGWGALLEMYPGDGDFGFSYSNMQRVGKTVADRVLLAREAIKRHPDYSVNYRNLGYDLGNIPDYPGAIAAMREYVRLDPNHGNTHETLAELLHWSGNRTEALQVAQRGIAVDPTFLSNYALLADFKLLNGDVAGARAEYARALGLGTTINDSLVYQQSTALSYLAAGDWRTAQTKLGEVATLAETRNVTATAILAHQRLAAMDGLYGDGKGIGAHLSKSAALGASNAGPQHRHAAIAYAGARQLDSARAAAARFAAIATDVNRANLHGINGFIAFQAGDAATAATELAQAGALDSFSWAIMSELHAKQARMQEVQKLRDRVRNTPSQTYGAAVLDFFAVAAKLRAKPTS